MSTIVADGSASPWLVGLFRRRRTSTFNDEWRALLDERMVHWGLLDDDERVLLEAITVHLLDRKRWEAANGFELTETVRLVIAAQAALLALGLGIDAFGNVKTILVHPTTQVLRGQRAGPAAGVVTDAPLPILGQTRFAGPVSIAWDEAADNARHPERGHNVVYHEFAHKLDLLDGMIDGTPPLETQEQIDRWVAVCTREYEDLRAGRGGRLLRDYAAVNTGEFFAVATEVFFDLPERMRREKRDLYEVLSDYYRQDPAARAERAKRR